MTPIQAAALLRGADVADPVCDARLLFDWAFGQGASRGAQTRDDPNTVTQSLFAQAIKDRVARKPVAQIVGRRAFWNHDFEVTQDVLDPRPDTETLVAEALRLPFKRVLDLGTGSGCILLSLLAERPESLGVGVDISDAALAVAARNADALGLSARVQLHVSNWFDQVQDSFDLIVSNPPYIALAEMVQLQPEVRDHEPHLALTDGGDGLACYRQIAQGVMAHLAPNGRVIVEIGPTQASAVAELMHKAGLVDVKIHPDLDGRDRCISGKKP